MPAYVTINQIDAAKKHAPGDHFKLYKFPDGTVREGPYFDVVAVFNSAEPALITPAGQITRLRREWAECPTPLTQSRRPSATNA